MGRPSCWRLPRLIEERQDLSKTFERGALYSNSIRSIGLPAFRQEGQSHLLIGCRCGSATCPGVTSIVITMTASTEEERLKKELARK